MKFTLNYLHHSQTEFSAALTWTLGNRSNKSWLKSRSLVAQLYMDLCDPEAVSSSCSKHCVWAAWIMDVSDDTTIRATLDPYVFKLVLCIKKCTYIKHKSKNTFFHVFIGSSVHIVSFTDSFPVAELPRNCVSTRRNTAFHNVCVFLHSSTLHAFSNLVW